MGRVVQLSSVVAPSEDPGLGAAWNAPEPVPCSVEEAWISPSDSPFRVPFDGSFVLSDAPTAPPEDALDGRRT